MPRGKPVRREPRQASLGFGLRLLAPYSSKGRTIEGIGCRRLQAKKDLHQFKYFLGAPPRQLCPGARNFSPQPWIQVASIYLRLTTVLTLCRVLVCLFLELGCRCATRTDKLSGPDLFHVQGTNLMLSATTTGAFHESTEQNVKMYSMLEPIANKQSNNLNLRSQFAVLKKLRLGRNSYPKKWAAS